MRLGFLGRVKNFFVNSFSGKAEVERRRQEQELRDTGTPVTGGSFQSSLNPNSKSNFNIRDFKFKFKPIQWDRGNVGGGVSSGPTQAEQSEQARIKALEREEQELVDAIKVVVENINTTPSLRPFSFDDAAARLRAEREFNPYFKEQLADYMRVVNIERRRASVDFKKATEIAKRKEASFFRKDERDKLFEDIANKRASRLRGLMSSGIADQSKNLLDIKQDERTTEAKNAFLDAQDTRKKGIDRFNETSRLKEEFKNKDIETKRKEAVEGSVYDERARERARYSEEEYKRQSAITSKEEKLASLQSDLSNIRRQY